MGSPNKRRKLNDTKVTQPGRNLDFFFGKQKKDTVLEPNTSLASKEEIDSKLTDEQLARKLQAEWDQEAAGSASTSNMANGGIEGKLSEVASNRTSVHDEVEDIYGMEGMKGPESIPKDESTAQTAPIFGGKNILSLQSAGSAEDKITSNIPFDESTLTFIPSKYIDDLKKHWAVEGGDASYALLTRCFILINSTQSRIKIVDTLVNLLRTIIEGDPSSLLPAVRIIITSCPSNLLSLSRQLRAFYIDPCLPGFSIEYNSSNNSRIGLKRCKYILMVAPGMACHKLYFTFIYFTRARSGRICYFQSTEAGLRTR